MCELLGVSSSRVTTINLSLTVLAERGEKPHMHGDGWGIAFHEGNDVRLIKDVGPAKGSQWVEFIKQQEIYAHDTIAHIRKSTVGKISYGNTHPFVRELYGKVHSFAHNGTLERVFENPDYQTRHYHPVGETDSERAFCVLLDRMKPLWEKHQGIPPLEERLSIVKEMADSMRSMGPANFLYTDGSAFFAHGDERFDPITNLVSWPGLHFIQIDYIDDEKMHLDNFADSLSFEVQNDVVTVFASVPLNDGPWKPLQRGEIIAVEKGRIISYIH